MKRRAFFGTALAAGAASPAAETPKNALFHLVYSYMRTGPQVERTTAYLKDVYWPAARRAGIAQGGFFSPVIGARSPYVLSLVQYPSFASMETVHEHFAGDKEFAKGWDEYNRIGDPAYLRMESTLLRGFDTMPVMETPPTAGRTAPRIFELRTYESNDEKAARRKIQMFDSGEIAIFRRLGMAPVFFGQGIIGSNLPSLTYMLAFDDLASRDKLWRAFGSDPEWQKLRTQPGFSDAEIVSNISNAILRPLPFSPIR